LSQIQSNSKLITVAAILAVVICAAVLYLVYERSRKSGKVLPGEKEEEKLSHTEKDLME
jgi:hypothetical protein